MDDLNASSLLAGILIGLLPALVVELSFKPRRAAQNVAKVLRAEIALNLYLLGLQRTYRSRNPKSIPSDFGLSKTTYEAVASMIGELEGVLLTDVILVYRRFAYLLEVRDLFGQFYDQREESDAGSERRRKLDQRLDTALEAFYRNLDKTVVHINDVLPRLDAVAYPSRRWKKGRSLEQAELDERVEAVAKLREENLRELKTDTGPYDKGL